MGATTEQHGWTPTVEWLEWADTFDARIGFRETDREPAEMVARQRADDHPRHRGDYRHGETSNGQVVWSVSTDEPAATVREHFGKALHTWLHDGEERVRAAMEAIEDHGGNPNTVRPLRHGNRMATTARTEVERVSAREEADEIRRVLAEYGKAPTPA